MRAGLARITASDYAPLPTVYDGLFPNGTLLTAPTRRQPGTVGAAPAALAEIPSAGSDENSRDETPSDTDWGTGPL